MCWWSVRETLSYVSHAVDACHLLLADRACSTLFQTAALRLPPPITKAEREMVVNETLQGGLPFASVVFGRTETSSLIVGCIFTGADTVDPELGLSDAADLLVEGGLRKGISGGERRRLSIGIVLISMPSILLLDVSNLLQYAGGFLQPFEISPCVFSFFARNQRLDWTPSMLM